MVMVVDDDDDGDAIAAPRTLPLFRSRAGQAFAARRADAAPDKPLLVTVVVTSNSLVNVPEPPAVLMLQIRLERRCQALHARPEDLATNPTHARPHHLGSNTVRDRGGESSRGRRGCNFDPEGKPSDTAAIVGQVVFK